MEPLIAIGIIVAALLAGLIGSLFGVGGGIIISPVLTLVFNIPLKEAIGASLVGVIATSTGAASRYVSQGLVNIRLGMIMEPATVVGSIIGAATAILIQEFYLAAAFGILLLYGTYYMIRGPEATIHYRSPKEKLPDFCGIYYDGLERKTICYESRNIPKGIGASFGAGITSGLLGIGGGLIQVPVMNVWMGVPMRAATATSNFMIGVTALAGAIVFYVNGLIEPVLAGTVAVGIFLGAMLGAMLSQKITSANLRRYFALLTFIISILMFLKAFGLELGV